MRSQEILKQINELTRNLIELGLCDNQNFPIQKVNRGKIEITIQGSTNIFLKNIVYEEIYKEILEMSAYNIQLLDGSLIILQYEFKGDELLKARLCFFPSPDLITYDEDFEIFENDELFAEILEKQRICFPIRFDYDKREEVFIPGEHPISHLTLGQYKNCRVPVSSAVTPVQFIHFILLHFYNKAYKKNASELFKSAESFQDSILPLEKEMIFVNIPS